MLCFFLLLAGCEDCTSCVAASGAVHSDINKDEQVVFFPTAGWLNVADQKWHLPIHGWIYEPEDSATRKALFARVLDEQFDLAPSSETDANFTRRVNLLLSDNERGKSIVVRIAGRDYAVRPSSENGHFTTTVIVPAAEVHKVANDGFLTYSAVMREHDPRSFKGEIRLMEPSGVSVISDIDDTVKITNVAERRSLLEYTFLLDFAAAPGMAELYGHWSGRGVDFHFVSSSPWQLYTPLREFLDENNFPWSTFDLKYVRLLDESILDLFKKGTATKPQVINTILATYPGRQFVLVGDSGEQDPEVYAALVREHPDQIQKIFIRNVTNESADNARFSSVFDGIDRDCWQLFDDPQLLRLPSGE